MEKMSLRLKRSLKGLGIRGIAYYLKDPRPFKTMKMVLGAQP